MDQKARTAHLHGGSEGTTAGRLFGEVASHFVALSDTPEERLLCAAEFLDERAAGVEPAPWWRRQ